MTPVLILLGERHCTALHDASSKAANLIHAGMLFFCSTVSGRLQMMFRPHPRLPLAIHSAPPTNGTDNKKTLLSIAVLTGCGVTYVSAQYTYTQARESGFAAEVACRCARAAAPGFARNSTRPYISFMAWCYFTASRRRCMRHLRPFATYQDLGDRARDIPYRSRRSRLPADRSR